MSSVWSLSHSQTTQFEQTEWASTSEKRASLDMSDRSSAFPDFQTSKTINIWDLASTKQSDATSIMPSMKSSVPTVAPEANCWGPSVMTVDGSGRSQLTLKSYKGKILQTFGVK